MAALTPVENYYMGTAVSTAQPGSPRMVMECGKFANLPAYPTGGYQLELPNFSSLVHFHCPFLIGASSLGIVRSDVVAVAGNLVTLRLMLSQVAVPGNLPITVHTTVAELASGFVLPASCEIHYFAFGTISQ